MDMWTAAGHVDSCRSCPHLIHVLKFLVERLDFVCSLVPAQVPAAAAGVKEPLSLVLPRAERMHRAAAHRRVAQMLGSAFAMSRTLSSS
jgi:hypothetical protein